MQLEQQKAGFERLGYNVAALSYDRVEAVRHFAERKGITYPLLADPESSAIKTLGLLNTSVPKDSFAYGVPHPGTLIVNASGVVEAKFMEDDYRDRFTPSSILVEHFEDAAGKLVRTVETKHLKLTASASDAAVRSGLRVVLALRVELKPGMHVYAPGVEGGYIPIAWNMAEAKEARVLDVRYPPSKMLHLPAIAETVPVYEGVIELRRDIVAGQNTALQPLLDGGRLVLRGSFRYQACDDKMCYRPESVPLEWAFTLEKHDSERVPEALRRGGD